jgi:RNA polymerase sigma factor (sigma-70 family)
MRLEVLTPTSSDWFDQFAEVEIESLLQLARVLTNGRQDAEDLVQDTLVDLFRRRQLVEAATDRSAYAHRALINRYRSSARKRRLATVSLDLVPEPGTVTVRSPAVEQIEDALLMASAVRDLPARQRAALVLHFYLDLSPKDVAEWMGIGESAARSNLARAIQKVRESIREQLGSSGASTETRER